MDPKLRQMRIRFGALLVVGVTLFVCRYRLSWGPYYAHYDISVTDTLRPTDLQGDLQFGSGRAFFAGSFTGTAMNVGLSSGEARIPDSAFQEYGRRTFHDPKDDSIGKDGKVYWTGDQDTLTTTPSRWARIPVRSRLPPRWPGQKYHLMFNYLPHDSIDLRIEVLDWNDCSHIQRATGKVAEVGSGPCTW